MTPLKVGDRIAYYDEYGRHLAMVIDPVPRYLGLILVKPDHASNNKSVHPKQCRKLPPKRRRVWVATRADGLLGSIYYHPNGTMAQGWTLVEFREVRPERK